MSAPKRIYVFCNSCSHEWHSATAMCEDGHVLGGHVCSDHGFIPGDMGVDGYNDWSGKRFKYAEHCPEGFEVLYLADPKNSPELDAAYALNQQLRIEHEAKQ